MTATPTQVLAIANALEQCDTVDGYSQQGVSNASTVDVFGVSIAPAQQVINFYDSNGAYLNSCLKSSPDGYSDQGVAGPSTVDVNGNPIAPGSSVINFYGSDGGYQNSCVKGADGFSRVGVADTNTVLDNDCEIKEGSKVLDYFDFTGAYQYSVYYPEQDLEVEVRVKPSEDAGAAINAAFECLPDHAEDQWREGCTWNVNVRPCNYSCDLSVDTVIQAPDLKQYHLKSTGPYGVNFINNTGSDDMIVVNGHGVGQNAHFSDFSVQSGNMLFTDTVRGKASVERVQFKDSPGGAITLQDAAGGLGPVYVRLEDNYFIGCKHAYVIDATTYLVVEINGGRVFESTDSSILVNAAVGVTIKNIDFRACDGIGYIELVADNGPIALVDIDECTFGGEATPRAGLPTLADIVYGTGATTNAITKMTLTNNDFNGSDVTPTFPGSVPHAIAFNAHPREVLIDGQNRFEATYASHIVGEAWTGGLNPQQIGGGLRRLRNYWGENVIQSTGLTTTVFENGGVGWEMPRIDHNLTLAPTESTVRMASANGQQYLLTVDNAGNPIVTPTGYL